MSNAPEVYYTYPFQRVMDSGQFQPPYLYVTAPGGGTQPSYPHGFAAYPGTMGHSAYPASAYPADRSSTPFFNFSNDRFLKGLLIGATTAYLLTNDTVQRGAIKGMVKVWTMLQGGFEEMKERFHDAEAEIRAAESEE